MGGYVVSKDGNAGGGGGGGGVLRWIYSFITRFNV